MPPGRASLKVITPRVRSAAAPVSRARRAAADPAIGTTQRIVDSITEAIVERRLMPGTKLAEQGIADIFNVSRTLVRQALNQLSRDHLVTLEPARGAFDVVEGGHPGLILAQPGQRVSHGETCILPAPRMRIARVITRLNIGGPSVQALDLCREQIAAYEGAP